MDVREKLEVIAHLGDHISHKEDIGICYDSALAKVIEDAYMALKNGVTVQKWISVNDRLPEEEGWYLVYTTPNREHKSINKAMFCKGYAWGNFEPYWRGAGGHWANVTHWMPLPQPPKGE